MTENILSVTVKETGHLEVRREDQVIHNGRLITLDNYRVVLSPGQDPASVMRPEYGWTQKHIDEVKVLVTATATPEKVRAWTAEHAAIVAAECAKCDEAAASLHASLESANAVRASLETQLVAIAEKRAELVGAESLLNLKADELGHYERRLKHKADELLARDKELTEAEEALAKRDAMIKDGRVRPVENEPRKETPFPEPSNPEAMVSKRKED